MRWWWGSVGIWFHVRRIRHALSLATPCITTHGAILLLEQYTMHSVFDVRFRPLVLHTSQLTGYKSCKCHFIVLFVNQVFISLFLPQCWVKFCHLIVRLLHELYATSWWVFFCLQNKFAKTVNSSMHFKKESGREIVEITGAYALYD